MVELVRFLSEEVDASAQDKSCFFPGPNIQAIIPDFKGLDLKNGLIKKGRRSYFGPAASGLWLHFGDRRPAPFGLRSREDLVEFRLVERFDLDQFGGDAVQILPVLA
jgi:hypothetical protein